MTTTPLAPPTADLLPLAQHIVEVYDRIFTNPLAVLLGGAKADLLHLSALTEAWSLVTGQRPPTGPDGEPVPSGSDEGRAWVNAVMEQIRTMAAGA